MIWGINKQEAKFMFIATLMWGFMMGVCVI